MEHMTLLHRLLYLFKQFELKIGLTNEGVPRSPVTGTARQLVQERCWTGALILAFVAHNAEEALTETHLQGTLLQAYSSNALSPSEQVMASMLLSCMALLWLGVALRARQLTYVSGINTALAGILLFNALVPHLLLFGILHSYTPGIITVLLFSIPLGVYQLVRQRRLGILTLPLFIKCLWAGLLMGLVGITLVLGLSKLLV